MATVAVNKCYHSNGFCHLASHGFCNLLVYLRACGDTSIGRSFATGNGFGCTNSLPMEFGLGEHTEVDELHIRWPSGAREVRRQVAADQVLVIEEER